MTASRIVPILAILALGIAVLTNGAKGKRNQIFDGLLVVNSSNYEFYPDAKACAPHGTAYWVVPNREFYERLRVDIEHVEHLYNGSWRMKLRADLSRIGRYGYQERYRRQITVSEVLLAEPLDCKEPQSKSY